MVEIQADAAIEVQVDPTLAVESARLRREVPFELRKTYNLIYDGNLRCQLRLGEAAELELTLGPPGGQDFDVVHIVVVATGDNTAAARAGALWSRDYGPPHTGPWQELRGELRLSTLDWRQRGRISGTLRLAGSRDGQPAVLVGSFAAPDLATGSCVAETGGAFREEVTD